MLFLLTSVHSVWAVACLKTWLPIYLAMVLFWYLSVMTWGNLVTNCNDLLSVETTYVEVASCKGLDSWLGVPTRSWKVLETELKTKVAATTCNDNVLYMALGWRVWHWAWECGTDKTKESSYLNKKWEERASLTQSTKSEGPLGHKG